MLGGTHCLFVSFDAVWAPPLVLLVSQLPADLREFMFAELTLDCILIEQGEVCVKWYCMRMSL